MVVWLGAEGSVLPQSFSKLATHIPVQEFTRWELRPSHCLLTRWMVHKMLSTGIESTESEHAHRHDELVRATLLWDHYVNQVLCKTRGPTKAM